jgi:hypothetical protein
MRFFVRDEQGYEIDILDADFACAADQDLQELPDGVVDAIQLLREYARTQEAAE